MISKTASPPLYDGRAFVERGKSEMHIHVNGEEREIVARSSVSHLLEELNLQADRVAVEINMKIIDRGEFDRYFLQENDRIEILSFIGGGSAQYSTPVTYKQQRVCLQPISRTYQKFIY